MAIRRPREPREPPPGLGAADLEPRWHEETSAYVTRFYTRVLEGYLTRVLEGYLAERARFEAACRPERYQQGLERLETSQRPAATGGLAVRLHRGEAGELKRSMT